MVFKRTAQEETKFNYFIQNIEDISNHLKSYASYADLASLAKIKENFNIKTRDFFREDRKLHIAVVGQVKAGKSSFLNTMLFNGMEVLPKASTPKTATLTKIEYGEENALCVEYYTKEEWVVLEENAKIDSEIDQVKVAKEIIRMVRENGISPNDFITKGTEKISFISYEELMHSLNEYVGENGKITPMVKSVVIYINNPNLKEISVVDTPGLNDPIASRTDKTRQFIEMCDVVFFLSRASQFVDVSDMNLLSLQLPQKGVKRLVLIASRYDEVLTDCLYDIGNLDEADKDAKVRLKKQARKTFEKKIDDLTKSGIPKAVTDVIADCKEPVYVSAMLHNMYHKSREDYDDYECLVYTNLSEFEDLTKEQMLSIGNIESVKRLFEEVVAGKEDMLDKKAASFIPNTMMELKHVLCGIKQKAESHVKLLATHDKEELFEKKKVLGDKINGIKAEIEQLFGELQIKLDKNKNEAVKDLRNKSNEYGALQDKQGSMAKTGTRTVSTSKWYNPFSWGTSSTYAYTYYEHYNYLEASDALENLRQYANQSANLVEDVFNNALNIAEMKRKCLTIVINNMDSSEDTYDASYFRLMTEKTLNEMVLPIINIDVSKYIDELSSKFSGEVTRSSEKEALKKLLGHAISELYEYIVTELLNELTKFRANISTTKDGFAEKLLENINADFLIILEQFKNKEEEIGKESVLIQEVEKMLAKI